MLSGGAGNDTIDAGSGDDRLEGGGGPDSLGGGSGAHTLNGGAGDDVLDGGGGTDDWAQFGAAVTVDLNAGTATGEGNDTLSGIENVDGGAGADTITGDVNANVLLGGSGSDTLSGGGDSIVGGTGDDIINGGAGADNLAGGVGADVFVYSVAGDFDATSESISGGSAPAETDVLQLDDAGTYNFVTNGANITDIQSVVLSEDDTGFAVSINDEMADANANDVVSVSADVAIAQAVQVDASDLTSANHRVVIDGGNLNGADTLTGGGSADTVAGGSGDDSIIGGTGTIRGADQLTGGTGNDDFVFGSTDATSSITDFAVVANLDAFQFDVSDFSTALGAGQLVSEAGNAAPALGNSTILAAANGVSTGATGSSESLFKITDTAGINSNADLFGDFTLSNNTGNAADAIVLAWYEADAGQMVVSVVEDTGAVADANINIDPALADTTVTDIVTATMSATDFTNFDVSNFVFIA